MLSRALPNRDRKGVGAFSAPEPTIEFRKKQPVANARGSE